MTTTTTNNNKNKNKNKQQTTSTTTSFAIASLPGFAALIFPDEYLIARRKNWAQ